MVNGQLPIRDAVPRVGGRERYQFNWRPETQSLSERFENERNLLPLPEFEPRIVQPVGFEHIKHK
jgi:hypothetical protein